MDAVFAVFILAYVGIAIYVLVNVLKTWRASVELVPSSLQRYTRHSMTKIRVFGRILKITLLNITTLLILISIVTSSLIAAAVYSDEVTEYIQEVDEVVGSPSVLIKLSEPTRKQSIAAIIHSHVEDVESTVYLYRVILDRGIRIEGVPEVKWVVIGIDGELLSKLNISEGEILTGCRDLQKGEYISTAKFKIRCSQNSISRFKIAPLETLLPVLGYIGLEPVVPSLDLITVSDIPTAMKILNLEEPLVTDVLVIGRTITRSTVEKLVDVLNVNTLQYYFNDKVLILGSARVMTLEAAVSTLLVILSCVIIVAVAYRSLLPEFKAVHERLHYIGLPQWGTSITLLMHVAVVTSLGSATSSMLISHFFSVRQVVISAVVSLLSGFLALLTLVREVGAGTTRYGSYTPIVERHEVVLPIKKVRESRNLVDIVREAIESNEFFELEEFNHKHWENEVVVFSRANFKEVWGVTLNCLIGITVLNGMIRMFIETEVSSVEDISESINNSIRALFVSKLIGKLKTLLQLPEGVSTASGMP
ncbi:MAG: hypothetical protein RMI56_06265 [Sulfolobales archaeon]|nr:hypothetical protein [Sulfolobales archaeon]MDW8083379.1 hypothetical protein [Sulfolobales archaeon]